MRREYDIEEMVWKPQWIRFAIMGVKGAGKSTSLQRVLLGIQESLGGRIGLVDADARRTALIADKYGDDRGYGKPLVIHMRPPFDGDSMAGAMHALVKAGCTILGIDGGEREHNGLGGYHDQANKATEEAFERKMANWRRYGEPKGEREPVRNTMVGWKVASQARQQFLSYLADCPAHVGITFDAKLRIDPVTGQSDGYAPHTGPLTLKSMHVISLLLEGSNGKPSYRNEKRERDLIMTLEAIGKPTMLDEAWGRHLAAWATHGPSVAKPSPAAEPVPPPERSYIAKTLIAACERATDKAMLLRIDDAIKSAWPKLSEFERGKVGAAGKAAWAKVG